MTKEARKSGAENSELDEALLSVWRQALLEHKKRVALADDSYPAFIWFPYGQPYERAQQLCPCRDSPSECVDDGRSARSRSTRRSAREAGMRSSAVAIAAAWLLAVGRFSPDVGARSPT